jgi:hypothetical protein
VVVEEVEDLDVLAGTSRRVTRWLSDPTTEPTMRGP